MKKILLTILIVLFTASFSYAVSGGTCTKGVAIESGTITKGISIRKVSVALTSDASGDVSGTANCQLGINGYVYMLVYMFGDAAAGADYTLNDSDGKDIMSTSDASPQLTDLAAANQQFMPQVGATISRAVFGDIDIVGADMGNAKTATLIFYIYEFE